MNDPAPPRAGLRLDLLPESPADAHVQARQFCLETIKEFYGFDYRADWHADLDSLLRPAPENHYSRTHKGAFWTLRDIDGMIVATAGIRHLAWKPNVLAMYPGRYGDGTRIASLWRVYVRAAWRGGGLGRWLTRLCEAEAARRGFETMYLHANSDTAATLTFWRAAGYREFGTCDTSTHFDKDLRRGTLA